MPMCGPYCDCYWCLVGHMAENHSFRQRLDQLVNEFKETEAFRAIQEENQKARPASEEEDP